MEIIATNFLVSTNVEALYTPFWEVKCGLYVVQYYLII
jgi:hypothetical protein